MKRMLAALVIAGFLTGCSSSGNSSETDTTPGAGPSNTVPATTTTLLSGEAIVASIKEYIDIESVSLPLVGAKWRGDTLVLKYVTDKKDLAAAICSIALAKPPAPLTTAQLEGHLEVVGLNDVLLATSSTGKTGCDPTP